MMKLPAVQSDLFAKNDTRIDVADADICYIDNFLDFPQSCYDALLQELDWRQDTIMMYGRPVPIPRLNAWYGDATAEYGYSGLRLNPLPWTETLQSIRQRIQDFTGDRFNSVLANFYRDGNDGVSWHSDDERELGENPVIASLSLGATRTFSLRHRFDRGLKNRHLPLLSGSLLIMRGTTQHYWQHQVPKQKKVKGGRINLTFRQIRPAG